MNAAPRIARHYGLDWLRIAAFALLILFHIGLYFAPGHWIVKSAATHDWVAYPLLAMSPWRLMLLFMVSGYATAALLSRGSDLDHVFRSRSFRLLLPLAFGALVIVPPQGWVRMQVAGIDQSLLHFWTHEEFSFATRAGLFFPNWEHLWFLAYLWAYTAILFLFLALVPDWHARLERVAQWFSNGFRLVLLPIAFITLANLAIMATHFDIMIPYFDIVGTVHYLPAFLLGFLLARSLRLRLMMEQLWRGCLIASTIALVILFYSHAIWGADPSKPQIAATVMAENVMAWTTLPVCYMVADRLLNHDHKWRQPLSRAVFPAFIVHQTIIVLAGWQFLQSGISGWPAFALMFALVIAGCALAYWLARDMPLVGRLLGCPPKAAIAPGEQSADKELSAA